MPDILNGPSKFDLMVSLMDSGAPRRSAKFEVQVKGNWLKIVIFSLEREDGSGESWNFEGQIINTVDQPKVNGHYSTKNRKGKIMLKM